MDWTRGKNERERLGKRAGALRVEGGRGRGRPGLRWEECEKRYLAGVGGEGRMRARDRGSGDGWVERDRCRPHPDKEGSNNIY